MLVEDPEGFARIDRRTASNACDHIGFEITVFFQHLSDGVNQRLRLHFIKNPCLQTTLLEGVRCPGCHSQLRHHLIGHDQHSLPRESLSDVRTYPFPIQYPLEIETPSVYSPFLPPLYPDIT